MKCSHSSHRRSSSRCMRVASQKKSVAGCRIGVARSVISFDIFHLWNSAAHAAGTTWADLHWAKDRRPRLNEVDRRGKIDPLHARLLAIGETSHGLVVLGRVGCHGLVGLREVIVEVPHVHAALVEDLLGPPHRVVRQADELVRQFLRLSTSARPLARSC